MVWLARVAARPTCQQPVSSITSVLIYGQNSHSAATATDNDHHVPSGPGGTLEIDLYQLAQIG